MKEKSNIKLIINTLINFIVFPWLLFGGVPIGLGILAGKPIWGIRPATLEILIQTPVNKTGVRDSIKP
jgi:hypothetical protein